MANARHVLFKSEPLEPEYSVYERLNHTSEAIAMPRNLSLFILYYGVYVNHKGYVNHLIYLPGICPKFWALCSNDLVTTTVRMSLGNTAIPTPFQFHIVLHSVPVESSELPNACKGC